MAVGSSLVRAARQQGQRCLAALRPTLAEAQLQQAGAGGSDAQQVPASGLLPGADARSLHHVCAAHAAAAAHHDQHALQLPAGLARATGCAAALAWHHLQLRGYALRSGYRPKPKTGMPDRNLPARNEQIRAPQASTAGTLAVLLLLQYGRPCCMLPHRGVCRRSWPASHYPAHTPASSQRCCPVACCLSGAGAVPCGPRPAARGATHQGGAQVGLPPARPWGRCPLVRRSSVC
jgi:hypothetical protein